MSAALAVTVTRHQCPHCRRTWAKRAAAEAHIARCWQNPEARGCKTCVHFTPPEPGPYPEHPAFPEQCAVDALPATGGLVTGCPDWEPA